jgi:hypothetical protein
MRDEDSCSWEEIHDCLPHRTPGTIQAQYYTIRAGISKVDVSGGQQQKRRRGRPRKQTWGWLWSCKHSPWLKLDEQRLVAYKKTSLGSGSLASSPAGLGPQYIRAGPWSGPEAIRILTQMDSQHFDLYATLAKMKEDNCSWEEISVALPSRSLRAIQVCYSTKFSSWWHSIEKASLDRPIPPSTDRTREPARWNGATGGISTGR